MISGLAKSIACFFVDNKLIDSEDEEVYAYGAELLLSTVFNLIMAILIALISGTFLQCLVFLTAFVTLRVYAGGYHADTHKGCMLTLAVVQCLFVLIIKLMSVEISRILVPLIIAFSVAVIIKLAPVEHPNKPLSDSLKVKLREKAVMSVSIWVVFSAVCTYVFNSIFGFCSAFGMLTISVALIAEKAKLRRNIDEKEQNPI